MKLLFLDIDGVLNSHAYMKCHPEDHIHHLDPEAIARVNTICDRTGAKVVISSTWRLFHSLPELTAMLQAKGLTAEVVGVTPEIRNRERGIEIKAFLRSLGVSNPLRKNKIVESFVILDDDSDMANLFPA